MSRTRFSIALKSASISIAVALLLMTGASADTSYKVDSFIESRGLGPAGTLIADKTGNIYGVTENGGTSGDGLAFELSRDVSGKLTYSVLYNFAGNADGQNPGAGLVLDHNGDLYGTTPLGGNPNGNSGIAYELTPAGDGQWTETVLYTFCPEAACLDGASPKSSLIFDGAGNLYGTTYSGGASNAGVVFELSPTTMGPWTEKVLYSFTVQAIGLAPQAGLIFDSFGDLYGTDPAGGTGKRCPGGCGFVYELTPSSDGEWQETTTYNFTGGGDGGTPFGGLISDSHGNLYGTTSEGEGKTYGTVFQLSLGGNGQWTETTLHTFVNTDGSGPRDAVALDRFGNIYGTTPLGGNARSCRDGCGTVFMLAPEGSGQYSETTLHYFTGSRGGYDGAAPLSGVLIDHGAIYGTTPFGGVLGEGVLFRLKTSADSR